jgi:hypothetical protein
MYVSELDIDFHEEEFQYWSKYERKSKERWSEFTLTESSGKPTGWGILIHTGFP